MSSNNNTDTENSCAEDDRILEGMYILVQRGDQERIIEFKATDTIHYGKGNNQQKVELKNVAKMPNYTSFRVKLHANEQNGSGKSNTASKFYLEPLNNYDRLPTLATSETTTGGRRDNRFIVDDNKAQRLNQAEIQALKEKGASSTEILETLVSNSASFSQRTEYSQEKYLKKKEKTYGDTVLVYKPTMSILADYFFKRDPVRILNIRPDTLSQILSYANVHANGKYLIYETGCNGLIVAAVLNRLRGMGLLLHVHVGCTPQRQAINFLNLKKSDLVPLKNLDVFYLARHSSVSVAANSQEASTKAIESSESTSTDIELSSEVEVPSKKPRLEKQKKEIDKNKEASNNPDKDERNSPSSAYQAAKVPLSVNRLDNETALATLQSQLFSGLIIAGKEHPLSILQCLLPRLSPSASFVIYSQTAEPLADCYTWLKDKNRGVNIHLLENWFRNIQVETDRTHPEINMSATGGYFLTGIATAS